MHNKFLNLGLLCLLSILLAACSVAKNPHYQDTSNLEMPPTIINVKKLKLDKYKEKLKNTGLEEKVILAVTTKKSALKIKKPFDYSWNTIEMALKLGKIEITDKNREQGVFYVLFNPDKQNLLHSAWLNKHIFALFNHNSNFNAFTLKVIWQENYTVVSAKLINNDNLASTDEAKLINTLYKIIKNNLLIN